MSVKSKVAAAAATLTLVGGVGFSNGPNGPELGTVDSNQLWGANFGVLH